MAKPAKHEILPLTIFSALFFSFLLPLLSHAKDTIRPKDTLTGNQTLVSAAGVFELGFFSDGFSGNYYLGIWFVADPKKKPVWVANRESPLIDPYSELQIRSDGNLILIDRRQTAFIINSDRLATTTNTSATLLDTGNFVLLAETNSQVWQSFDYPSDTFLPGMKIGWFGLNSDDPRYRLLVSWVSSESPGRGAFTLGVNNSTLNTLTVWRGDSVHMDIGFWEGGKFRFIFENSSGNYNLSHFTSNEGTYFSFSSNSLSNKHVSKWFVMASNGNLDEFSISPEGKISSVSHVLCEDSAGGNTGKCLIKIPYKCEDGDNFSEINGTMPTSLFLRGSINLGFSECEFMCRSNCSCSAFTSFQDDLNGCHLYFGRKNDIFKVVEKGSGIVYVRGDAPRQSDSFAAANKLGEGGFGTVYKGRLPEGQEIAVKRLSKISRQGTEEFINEILQEGGYMSPEYAMDGLFSEKSDVFSFGVILLEIISGKKNIAFFETNQSLNLLGKAWNLWKEGKCMELIDQTLHDCCPKDEEVMRCVQLGLLCVQERAFDRPTISDVLFMLSHQTTALPPPTEPAFLSQLNSRADVESSSSRHRLYSEYDITISEVHPR
nr:receptor-like serine/threonine-protein kinase SD1-8 [Ziziphus jujuba var. spinosa]